MERRKILPIPGLELKFLGRPARIQSLYRLLQYLELKIRLPSSDTR
jgi:hypothetical protein